MLTFVNSLEKFIGGSEYRNHFQKLGSGVGEWLIRLYNVSVMKIIESVWLNACRSWSLIGC